MNISTLKIDNALSNDEIHEIAKFAQFYNEDDPRIALIDERFGHDQSPEFYRGMISTLELVMQLRSDISDSGQYAGFLMLLKHYTALATISAIEGQDPGVFQASG